MKVLIVSDVLGEENNGTTIAAMNLYRYLKSQNDDVRILCSDQDKKGHKDFYVVPNIYLGYFVNKLIKKNNVSLAKPKTKIIKEALKDVDIVHVIFPFALGKKTTKIARKMGIPVTASFHCQAENFSSHILHTMNLKWFNDIVYKNFYKGLFKYVNAIHYPTEFIKNLFESVIKVKTNSYIISNGVNDLYVKKEVTRPKELSGKYNILFIGRFAKEKSHKLLVKAVSMSKYKSNIQLVFAGQGPQVKNVKCLANKLKINEPIIKFYSREELVDVINSCDLYVHPAIVEIEAISCLEAISCGLVPVISDSKRSATNNFALSEKNLFKYNSPKDLAEKIDYWIEHEDEKEKCQKAYKSFKDEYNQEICMKKMRNMLLTYAKPINHTDKKTYYYKDEINDDFANNGIVAKQKGNKHRYIHKCPIWNLLAFILYFIVAKPIVFLLNKIVYRQKIINHLIVKKKDIKGCFIYANHTLAMGDAYTPNIIFARRNNIVVGQAAMSIKVISSIVSMLGGMPLPIGYEATSKFLKALEIKTSKGQNITIYPEAHIWPYYTDIRNYLDSSFTYPVNLNKPVICITNTYVPYKKKYRLLTHIDGPIYPNININKKNARTELRNSVYEIMKQRSLEVKQFEKCRYINLNDIEVKD